MSYISKYPRPSVTVDCVTFRLGNGSIDVLLIRRAGEPFAGSWALPGGFVDVRDDGDQGESLEDATRRELKEETNLEVGYLEQLYTFGKPLRDPRGRTISVAYIALLGQIGHTARSGSDAKEVRWFPISEAENLQLAFDHQTILKVGIDRLRAKIRYTPVGLELLSEQFTLGDVQRLYETALSRDFDTSNFRKKILAAGVLVEGGTKTYLGKTIQLYKINRESFDQEHTVTFNFDPRFVSPVSFLYLAPVQSGERFKIGFSNNPQQRFTSLLDAIDESKTLVVEGDTELIKKLERHLHKFFARHRVTPHNEDGKTEWFDSRCLTDVVNHLKEKFTIKAFREGTDNADP